MKLLGFVLVVLGVLAVVYTGVRDHRQRTVLDVGPFKAVAAQPKDLPLSPIVGGLALLGGVLLLLVADRRRAWRPANGLRLPVVWFCETETPDPGGWRPNPAHPLFEAPARRDRPVRRRPTERGAAPAKGVNAS